VETIGTLRFPCNSALTNVRDAISPVRSNAKSGRRSELNTDSNCFRISAEFRRIDNSIVLKKDFKFQILPVLPQLDCGPRWIIVTLPITTSEALILVLKV